MRNCSGTAAAGEVNAVLNVCKLNLHDFSADDGDNARRPIHALGPANKQRCNKSGEVLLMQ